jgi:outer membrane PBP1 activator LpoA protein
VNRRFFQVCALALVCLTMALTFTSCKCTAEKGAVVNVQKTHDLIAKKFLKYVDTDASLSDADKKDWRALVESDQRNIDALKKSLGE